MKDSNKEVVAPVEDNQLPLTPQVVDDLDSSIDFDDLEDPNAMNAQSTEDENEDDEGYF